MDAGQVRIVRCAVFLVPVGPFPLTVGVVEALVVSPFEVDASL
jgi:hypothetical protein